MFPLDLGYVCTSKASSSRFSPWFIEYQGIFYILCTRLFLLKKITTSMSHVIWLTVYLMQWIVYSHLHLFKMIFSWPIVQASTLWEKIIKDIVPEAASYPPMSKFSHCIWARQFLSLVSWNSFIPKKRQRELSKCILPRNQTVLPVGHCGLDSGLMMKIQNASSDV